MFVKAYYAIVLFALRQIAYSPDVVQTVAPLKKCARS
jgi:hypothetical protein